MLITNIRMALDSLRSARWRTFLTMLGVIIGVTSVVTTVSLGEGIKAQIIGEINRLGSDTLTISPGNLRPTKTGVQGFNVFGELGDSSLTMQDLAIVQQNPNVTLSAPANFSGYPITNSYDDTVLPIENGLIVSSNEHIIEVLNQKVEYGEFFSAEESNKNIAIIGRTIADQLFAELSPIGKSLRIKGQDYFVKGVMETYPSSPISVGLDYNNVVYIPFEAGQRLGHTETPQIRRIFLKVNDVNKVDETKQQLEAAILAAHADQKDFSVLKQDEFFGIINTVFSLLTSFIAGIAGISLLVGGIGIMNIMLVSVSERTREIGIRKAVGATNRQILYQFLTEAMVISILGGVIGMAISGGIAGALRVYTDLKPVISPDVVIIAGGLAVSVGIVFGIAPALRAARKDPIEALRFE
jgi:putative ABC transport system permease protein